MTTTSYTLDLNTGLTQILSDGAYTYTYGLERIAQVDLKGIPQYFLPDALGSVRQLTDSVGAVTLANAYDPYGIVTQTSGSGTSTYGYTGETTDTTGMVYLRARYYMSNTGRFLTRDTWNGDYNRPLSLNRWNYVEGNPVNLTDPSGHDPWWCETASDPAACFRHWIAEHTNPSQNPSQVPIDTCTPTQTATPTQTPTPILQKDIAEIPYPGNPAYNNYGAWGKTTMKYKAIRDWMLDNASEDLESSTDPEYGPKLKDETLLAIISLVEFNTIAVPGKPIFVDSLGALSNQYYDNMFCNGNCGSIMNQLIWLSNKQGIRTVVDP